MKKIFLWMLIAFVGIAFSSCEGFNKKQTEFFLKDLQGYWLEDGTQVHARYTTESAGTINNLAYLWGYSWDEADDVYEADVIADKYGNGWFKYHLTVEGQLLRIEQMNGQWSDIPKPYTMTVLTGSKMTYHPKDYPKEKVNWTKLLK